MDVSVRPSNSAWGAVIICWMFALSAVWVWTVRYEFATDQPAKAYSQRHWPGHCSLELDQARPTLVFFLHPKCPCTRASVRELEKLLTGSGLRDEQQPRIFILVSHPKDVSDNWHDTDILRRASKLPQSQLILDPDGRETSRFGAVSSGTVMFYDTGGQRLFAGGVTASRGHEGDNAGSDALGTLLAGQAKSVLQSTPAFGCRLCSPAGPQDVLDDAIGGCSLCEPTED